MSNLVTTMSDKIQPVSKKSLPLSNSATEVSKVAVRMSTLMAGLSNAAVHKSNPTAEPSNCAVRRSNPRLKKRNGCISALPLRVGKTFGLRTGSSGFASGSAASGHYSAHKSNPMAELSDAVFKLSNPGLDKRSVTFRFPALRLDL